MPWGCDAPAQTVTSLLTTNGKYLKNRGPFPCSNKFPGQYQTLRDLLDAKSVSWKYYSPCFSAWNKNNCDQGCPHTCAGALLNAFDVIDPVRHGSEWGTKVSMPETNFFDDVAGGTLPAVSWIIPADENNDHPGEKVDHGPSWVASVVNAIGTSGYWKSTAIVILWDDWGGMYDNAVPPFQDHTGGLGFRVPCMIVSAYALTGNGSRGGYVAHTHYEFGSILRYIEQTFKLGSLGTTDARAKSILNAFDYAQSPRKFTKIQSAVRPAVLQVASASAAARRPGVTCEDGALEIAIGNAVVGWFPVEKVVAIERCLDGHELARLLREVEGVVGRRRRSPIGLRHTG